MDPVVVHAAAAGIAAVLLIGAVEKLRAPEVFADAVDNYRLLPAWSVGAAARALPWLELLAGALLLPTATRGIGAALALALLLLFTAAIGINLLRGRTRIDCGCGGNEHIPLSGGLVVRNAVLMGLAMVAAITPAARPAVWLDALAAGFAAIFLLGAYFLANAVLRRHSLLLDLRNLP